MKKDESQAKLRGRDPCADLDATLAAMISYPHHSLAAKGREIRQKAPLAVRFLLVMTLLKRLLRHSPCASTVAITIATSVSADRPIAL